MFDAVAVASARWPGIDWHVALKAELKAQSLPASTILMSVGAVLAGSLVLKRALRRRS